MKINNANSQVPTKVRQCEASGDVLTEGAKTSGR